MIGMDLWNNSEVTPSHPTQSGSQGGSWFEILTGIQPFTLFVILRSDCKFRHNKQFFSSSNPDKIVRYLPK